MSALRKALAAAEAKAFTAEARATEAEARAANAAAMVSDAEAEIAFLKLTIEKLRREMYGWRSERKQRLLDQLELQLDELEASATEDELAAERAAAGTTQVEGFTRRRPGRKPFPAHLPRERVVVLARGTRSWSRTTMSRAFASLGSSTGMDGGWLRCSRRRVRLRRTALRCGTPRSRASPMAASSSAEPWASSRRNRAATMVPRLSPPLTRCRARPRPAWQEQVVADEGEELRVEPDGVAVAPAIVITEIRCPPWRRDPACTNISSGPQTRSAAS